MVGARERYTTRENHETVLDSREAAHWYARFSILGVGPVALCEVGNAKSRRRVGCSSDLQRVTRVPRVFLCSCSENIV